MPSKSQVLLKFQQDLQELNARFEDEIAAIEGDRLRKFRALSESRALVEGADLKTAEAVAERKADRERATTGRDQAVAVATQKRRVALEASQKTWRKAEEQLGSALDDARLQESRRHEDKLGEIDAILPMYKQAAPREAESERHEQALARIQQDYESACDRAREDYQTANDAALADELRATELANDAEHEGRAAADAECERTLENVRAQLSDELLKRTATKELEEDFQQQLRDARGRWASEKEALRSRFKADYDAASEARGPRPGRTGGTGRALRAQARQRGR